MSNYRSFYGLPTWSDAFTPKQRRRGARKAERDLLRGEPPAHPRRGRGPSGNPAGRPHHQTAAWGGMPGECGAECACGTTYDGFDTIAEADALLDGHISAAAARRPRTRPPLRGSISRYVAVRPAPGQRLVLMERAAYLAQAEVG